LASSCISTGRPPKLVFAARYHFMQPDQRAQAKKHGCQQHSQRHLGVLGPLDGGRAELGHRVGDCLDSGQRGTTRRKGLENQHQPQCLGRTDGAQIRTDNGYRMRTDEPDDDDGEDTDDEHQRRSHQHLGRLGDADQVDGGDQDKPGHRHGQQVMRHHRKDAAQTGCPGRQTDRNGQHVVDD
jgi:hypothetical protein